MHNIHRIPGLNDGILMNGRLPVEIIHFKKDCACGYLFANASSMGLDLKDDVEECCFLGVLVVFVLSSVIF